MKLAKLRIDRMRPLKGIAKHGEQEAGRIRQALKQLAVLTYKAYQRQKGNVFN